mmetsp:Transcript_51671/g.102732  ORF Transcript_51671/g.102732 Transcript_51671/m.102732 type:complete len:546 (+) Transcript_51671:41-1678(+)
MLSGPLAHAYWVPARTEHLLLHKGITSRPQVNCRTFFLPAAYSSPPSNGGGFSRPGTLAPAGTEQPGTAHMDWMQQYLAAFSRTSMAAEPSDLEATGSVGAAMQRRPQAVSVDEYLVAAGGWGKFQNRLFATMFLHYACISFDWIMAAFLAPALGAQWGLTLPQQEMIASSWFVGGLIGFLLSGFSADTLGRRPSMLAFGVLHCFGAVFTCAAPSLPLLLAARILTAIGTIGAFNMTYPLLAEFSPPSERAVIKKRMGLNWQCGVVALVVVAYQLRSFPWQALSLALVPACSFGVLWLFRGLPESPRFLLVKGRHAEALESLRVVASSNGRLYDCEHLRLAAPSKDGDDGKGVSSTIPTSGPMALLASGQLGRTLALLTLNLVASCTYYGLTFAPVASLGTNLYLCQLTATLLEIPALLLISPLANQLGRRFALISFLGVFACASVALTRIPVSATQLRLAAVLVGRMSGSALNTLKWVAVAENFPTAIRGTGLAVTGIFGMLGASFGPLIFAWAPSPFRMLSILCLLGVAAVLLLPETNGKDLD